MRGPGQHGDECEEFSSDKKPLSKAPISSCLSPQLTYFEWGDEKTSTCIAHSACGTDLGKQDPLYCKQLPNPFAKKASKAGFTWSKCGSEKDGTTTPFDEKGNFEPECAPDTLYSWQSVETIKKYYAGTQSPTQLFNLNGHALYTAREPVGTFGYGRDSLRLKLKPGAKFVLVDSEKVDKNCASFKAKGYDVDHSIFVTKGMSEYIFCSDQPVESWSVDSALHLQEIKDDLDWIEKHSSEKSFDSYTRGQCPWTYEFDVWHGHTDWNKSTLEINMALIKMKIDEQKGAVNYRKDEIPSLWKHFSTQQPGYFNGRDSSIEARPWVERDPNGCR